MLLDFFLFSFFSPRLSQEIKPLKSSSTEISGKPLIEFRILLNQRVFLQIRYLDTALKGDIHKFNVGSSK